MTTFVREREISAPVGELFAWHERPGAFERLSPPWEQVEIVSRTGGIKPGARVVLKNRLGPISTRWEVEHRDYERGRLFRDVQLSGPFSHWDHAHIFREAGEAGSVLEDRIEYALPLGWLGRIAAGRMAHKKLDQLFRYRHDITAGDLELQHRHGGQANMKVLITGQSGLVGTALTPFLTTQGHDVVGLHRAAHAESPWWNPETGEVDAGSLAEADALVHLAGVNIVGARWSDRHKAAIRDSRVDATRKLSEWLAQQPQRPRVMIAASAIGFYGDRGNTALDENTEAGTGFLPAVCRDWEEATQPLADAGTRVVNLRIGVVLTPRGGALTKMLLPFRAGMGGVIGDGTQYTSWIGIDDLLGAILHSLMTDSLSGPVNATAPVPVTNREFTKTLGRVLRRPTFVPLPAFAARLALGEVADALLLASTRVIPVGLLNSGYKFRHRELEPALRHLLGRHQPG